jgi:putative oxidoreductase
MSIGLLVLRLVVGGLFAGHGAQKLFGWFGGHGLRPTGGFFENLGFRPGLPFAFLAGLSEFGGGLLFAAGLLTPFAATVLIGVMTTAIAAVHWTKGIWNTNGGIEFPLMLGTAAFAVAATGPGRYSLDNAFGIYWHGIWWALGAAALGILGGLGSIVFARLLPAGIQQRVREAA